MAGRDSVHFIHLDNIHRFSTNVSNDLLTKQLTS